MQLSQIESASCLSQGWFGVGDLHKSGKSSPYFGAGWPRWRAVYQMVILKGITGHFWKAAVNAQENGNSQGLWTQVGQMSDMPVSKAVDCACHKEPLGRMSPPIIQVAKDDMRGRAVLSSGDHTALLPTLLQKQAELENSDPVWRRH